MPPKVSATAFELDLKASRGKKILNNNIEATPRTKSEAISSLCIATEVFLENLGNELTLYLQSKGKTRLSDRLVREFLDKMVDDGVEYYDFLRDHAATNKDED
ncbi:hypothetical protein PCE1_004962 [Barthelona sp. PCE]